MDLAIYDLKLHKGRFIATIIGVGLLFTIVLAMNGIYRGLIFERTAVIKVTNPDLWVVERFRGGPPDPGFLPAIAGALWCRRLS
jgi:putative ABC transport system permease protein